MKRQMLASLVAVSLSLSATSAFAAKAAKKEEKKAAASAELISIDPAASSVAWEGRKVVGPHNGHLKLKNGQVEVKNGKIVGGVFEVDMTSLTNEDVKSAEFNAKLVGHLKSDDFFSVDKHPVSTFKITGAKDIAGAAAGQPNVEISGDLTIKGKTLPATLPAIVTIKDGKAEAKGTLVVDRTQYDIKYNSGKFFQGLGDKLIDDKFNVTVTLVGAVKK